MHFEYNEVAIIVEKKHFLYNDRYLNGSANHQKIIY